MDGPSNLFMQAIVSDLIRQGSFSQHLRRMRLLYKQAQDELLGLIAHHLPHQLRAVACEAGMHLVAWLPPGVDAEGVAQEASKLGVMLTPLDRYSLHFQQPQGLLLGFAGFSHAQLEEGILCLKQVLPAGVSALNYYPLRPGYGREYLFSSLVNRPIQTFIWHELSL